MAPVLRSQGLRSFLVAQTVALAAVFLPLLAVLAAHAVERALASVTAAECSGNACLD